MPWEDEFNSWKGNRITKAVLSDLRQDLERITTSICDPETKDILEVRFMQGIRAGILSSMEAFEYVPEPNQVEGEENDSRDY